MLGYSISLFMQNIHVYIILMTYYISFKIYTHTHCTCMYIQGLASADKSTGRRGASSAPLINRAKPNNNSTSATRANSSNNIRSKATLPVIEDNYVAREKKAANLLAKHYDKFANKPLEKALKKSAAAAPTTFANKRSTNTTTNSSNTANTTTNNSNAKGVSSRIPGRVSHILPPPSSSSRAPPSSTTSSTSHINSSSSAARGPGGGGCGVGGGGGGGGMAALQARAAQGQGQGQGQGRVNREPIIATYDSNATNNNNYNRNSAGLNVIGNSSNSNSSSYNAGDELRGQSQYIPYQGR